MFNFFDKDLNIFLIRHGESIINTGENMKKTIPVHKASLTASGKEECEKTAKFLVNYLKDNKLDKKKSAILYSPYKVSVDTMNIFNKYLKIDNQKEDISLIERRFGTAEMLSWDDWANLNKEESELFSRYYNNSGKFYAKFPLGDSPFDTALRVKQAVDEAINQYKHSHVRNIFIFTHGITLRTFVMRFCNYPVDWYEEQQNPDNCAIYNIVYNKKKLLDKGYIHDKKYNLKLSPIKKKRFFAKIFDNIHFSNTTRKIVPQNVITTSNLNKLY